ncbi:MAG: polyphosphate kinase 1 [Bacteroidota bacterium]
MSVNLKHPKYYFNRELSWLQFNDRVLEEAADRSHPLLERLKFIAIFSSNLDEFFMIRVGGLKEQLAAEIQDIPADGLPADQQVKRISTHVHQSVQYQNELLLQDILPKMRRKGIRLRKVSSLRKHEKAYLQEYFMQQIFPVLTPLAIDPTHPFPLLKSLGINILVELRTPYKNDQKRAVVYIPQSLKRFIPLPQENGKKDFVLLEDVISHHVQTLFPNMKLLSKGVFRITRNADLDLAEAEADDLLKYIERELRKRRLGTVIRLEVAEPMSAENREFLMKMTNLQEEDVYDVPQYVDLSAFMGFLGLDYPDLKDKPFTPTPNHRFIKDQNVFQTVSKGDVLLHHPYDSFNHVADFLTEAAEDPKVLAIKQTLYRTSGGSSIVRALKRAAENGKQVTALIELKARFDEENNIGWAKELDNAGVNVVYGILGLKTHCKIAMVVRQENDRIRRYLHLSTGNYNEKTARLYTDIGLMTCDEEMGVDGSALFNLLTGYSLQKEWRKFLVAPTTLRSSITRMIEQTTRNHSKENPGRIIIVVNSLVDPETIRMLYKASMTGVKVDLVIRGICCLRPGIPGISDNIQVKSIVGRFLEHTRVFYFKSNGQSQIYMGSADLMQRNLDRRVELVFPIEDIQIKRRVRSIIQVLLDDDQKSRYLTAKGVYVQREGRNKIDAQAQLLGEAQARYMNLDTIPVA